jgi:hypothetical protein
MKHFAKHPPALLVLASLGAGACSARPARFADRPAVTEIADDTPIPMPRPFDPVREVVLSEAYVRRPLVDALDPLREPDAGDVNALDEVPRSRWFSPEDAAALADDAEPPAPPFRPLIVERAATHENGLAVIDARGKRFELFRDPPDRPEMATSSAVAATRLVRALGYYTPGVWPLSIGWNDFHVRGDTAHDAVRAFFKSGPRGVEGRFRAAATRWPIGTDLGPTRANERRADDPNDRVPHEDRRTLRALKAIFGWLGMTTLDREVLRDAYLGAPGRGYVVHYVTALHGAFGADAVVRVEKPRDDDKDLEGRNVWVTLGSLGLHAPKVQPTQTRWPSLGEYAPDLAPNEFRTSPPFDPMDRQLPGDAYWASKRILAIDTEAVARAIDAAEMSDADARAKLYATILARRLVVARAAFAAVTPCELERVDRGGEGREAAVVLRDEAVVRGFVAPEDARYRTELVDDLGNLVVGQGEIAPRGPRFAVPLPESAKGYVVLRVRSLRAGKEARRAMEVHLVQRDGGAWAAVGVRH